MSSIVLQVNGREHTLDVDPETPLLWVLRDQLGLVGTRYSCGTGLCGACTVHVDGQATRSCILPVSEVAGRQVVTIEGLSADGSHPVQQAWLAENVCQCGYCQPGQIMAAAALLARVPDPSDDEIDAALAGNLCRCGTYPRIRRAISISGSYDRLRQAGAAARAVLVSAAAQTWGVDRGACRTENGEVIHPDGSQRLGYGALVEIAAGLPLPSTGDAQVKDPSAFRLIGTARGLCDAPDMVTGRALYTSDVQLPGMVYAVVARCPVPEGQVAAFDDGAARAVPGVRDIVPISSGLAVVADHTWAAIRGRSKLDITWDEGRNADLSSEATRQLLAGMAPTPGGLEAGSMDAVYDIPYLAHATMEPMVCVADVRADRCEVWAPSQAPQAAKQQAMSSSGLDSEAVTVHVPVMGGGFGRRHVPDFVGEAVEVSRAVGAPVKLTWTREDDLQHDRYHPISVTYIKAALDASGLPTAMPRPQPYPMAVGIPTGYWRSVEQMDLAFARGSFLDEIAAAGGLDPVELRLSLLSGRGRAVVELAAQKAGWGEALPEGWGRGIAYWATFGVTHVAQVVEVSVAADGAVRARRVVCAVDCGTVVNPDTAVAQMEGGILFALTAALKARITVDKGRVQQSNFHDYPLLTIAETPAIEVYLVDSGERPSGVGEMGVPPLAPAVANAVYAATGRRVRHLPIVAADLV